jgi:hypothetical protein
MKARTVSRSAPARVAPPAVALAIAIAVTGCGDGSDRTPDVSKLPLVHGARIIQSVRRCDPGANSYCGLELVVEDPAYRSSLDLLAAEERHLRASGWAAAHAQIGQERAADSPGHKLHVNYATAYGDLLGIDSSWIKRSPKTAVALSNAMFDRASVLSIELVFGAR